MAVIWIEPLRALNVQKEVLIPSMKSGVHNKTNVVIFPIRITQIPTGVDAVFKPVESENKYRLFLLVLS